jgi:hypothetical protein
MDKRKKNVQQLKEKGTQNNPSLDIKELIGYKGITVSGVEIISRYMQRRREGGQGKKELLRRKI